MARLVVYRHLIFAAATVGSIVAVSFIDTPSDRAEQAPVEYNFEFEKLPVPLIAPEQQEAALLQPDAPTISAVDALPSGSPEPPAEQAVSTWTHNILSGETLDAILANAGLDKRDRAESALALGKEYDLRRLRPGHEVTVITTLDGVLRRVVLQVDNGIVIEAIFDNSPVTRVITPEPEIVSLAGQTTIQSSLFAALARANIPTRFAIDLDHILSGIVNFRRDLSGGETLQLLWRETRIDDEAVGSPFVIFASLDVGDTLYEVVWPDDGSGYATIYRDGDPLRTFIQPVDGARLSSAFGRRRHPVFGNMRMHTGVDFAAEYGTPVRATASGYIDFVGRRNGYGQVIEIAHGSGTKTRYAHLSGVFSSISEGREVAAGEAIGRVGASGTATGANLHYEVLIHGRPINPLSEESLANTMKNRSEQYAAIARLAAVRETLDNQL